MTDFSNKTPKRNMNKQETRKSLKECPDKTWGGTMSILQDLHYRKIMRRTDCLKILFICVCICHVSPAHPCGDNPLRLVDNFSRTNGQTTDFILTLLKDSYPNDYNRLMTDYQLYLQCIQMVNTGYFKRSIRDEPRFQTAPPTQFDNNDERKEFIDKTLTHLLDSSRDEQNQEMFQHIVESLSNNGGNYNQQQYINKDTLPLTVKRLLDNNSLSPLLKRIFKKYRTADVSYDDFNTL